jgi:hypothetical protein
MSVDVSITREAAESNGHAPSKGEALSAISRRVVGLLKEHSGKGPVKARAYYWNDLLVVMMTDGYTTVEHTLLDELKPLRAGSERGAVCAGAARCGGRAQ